MFTRQVFEHAYAVALGAAEKVLALEEIAQAFITQLEKMQAGSRL